MIELEASEYKPPAAPGGSSVENFAPAAPPNPLGTRMLALLQRMEQDQWWPPERLREMQFRRLRVLLDHAQETVPYYRGRLESAGFKPGNAVTPELWARIPLLRREDIQDAGTTLRSRQLPVGHGRTSEITTSGSTGKPVTVMSTAVTRLFWSVLTVRDHLWHRRDVTGTLAAIRNVKSGGATYPRGANIKIWGRATAAIYRTGPGALLNITTPVEQQVEWLQRQNASYLVTFPSNLEALVTYCEDRKISFATLRQVGTLGETLPPRARDACRKAWRVPVADMYSSEEIGYIALQCPDHAHYHVQAENALVEILDDAGRTCRPGEIGRVVVTHLHNFATPLIRYDLGDYAEAGEACPCGRGLPVLTRIMGRVRNMLTLPSGQRYWPSLGDTGYADIAPIRQFQFVQKTPEQIDVKLVTDRDLSESEEEKLRELIWSRLGYPFALTFTYHDKIARSAGGKYEDFRSEVAS